MIGKPATPEAYKLLHDGVLALSKVEAAGMKIDTEYLDKAIHDTRNKIITLESKIMKHKFWRTWKKMFGQRTTIGSKTQFIKVLEKELGLSVHYTEKGNIKSDKATFDMIDHPFPKDYNEMQRLIKADSTYLRGLKREVDKSFIHPVYDLHIPVSYRPSASHPNLYNFPKRDEDIAELIRRSIIPRKNHVLVELDYSGIEVRISCCYHKDNVLISYVKDPSKDMHRDTGGEIFMCKKEQVSKEMRFVSKNSFVFAEFYGSVYQQCAPNIWGEMERRKLALVDGTPVLKHLKAQGIKDRGDCSFDKEPKRGTFEMHLKGVEDSFWKVRFKKYAKWKKRIWENYLDTGYIEYLNGFIVRGIYKRNELINLPIQGTAFHCLLWSEIQLTKWLIKHKMKTRIVNQIYDSLMLDVHKKELKDVVAKAKQIMEHDVREHWEWINVPLAVECEIGEKNWFEMKAY